MWHPWCLNECAVATGCPPSRMMTTQRRRTSVQLIRWLVVASIFALIVTPAAAQDTQNFPNRPIRIIVPFPAGGPTDILTRIVAQKMSEDFGQAVIVENRPGADTAIGAVQVAKAAP